jgi:hypothetical protein
MYRDTKTILFKKGPIEIAAQRLLRSFESAQILRVS